MVLGELWQLAGDPRCGLKYGRVEWDPHGHLPSATVHGGAQWSCFYSNERHYRVYVNIKWFVLRVWCWCRADRACFDIPAQAKYKPRINRRQSACTHYEAKGGKLVLSLRVAQSRTRVGRRSQPYRYPLYTPPAPWEPPLGLAPPPLVLPSWLDQRLLWTMREAKDRLWTRLFFKTSALADILCPRLLCGLNVAYRWLYCRGVGPGDQLGARVSEAVLLSFGCNYTFSLAEDFPCQRCRFSQCRVQMVCHIYSIVVPCLFVTEWGNWYERDHNFFYIVVLCFQTRTFLLISITTKDTPKLVFLLSPIITSLRLLMATRACQWLTQPLAAARKDNLLCISKQFNRHQNSASCNNTMEKPHFSKYLFCLLIAA